MSCDIHFFRYRVNLQLLMCPCDCLQKSPFSPFQEIAVLKDVRALHMIPGELVKPFKSSVPPRLAQSRVDMVEKLLAELGTENSGFTLENVVTVNGQH